MLLKIFKNRTVSSSGTWGTKNENNYEILNFEFPEELEEYNKRIVYYLGDEKVWDAIVNNKAILTNAITTKGSVKAYIWCTKSDEAFETDVDFRTQIFVMNFFENDNADGIVPTPEQVDGFNTMLTAMNEKIEEINELETTIENAETQRQENEETRQENESTRQDNEQTRQEQEADRERRTNEAIGQITDMTQAYNQNAQEKTNAFNQNATNKTTDFNNNASSKKSDFNSNAESKTTTFNNNASSKTTAFNENATSKTNTFNSNANDKTSAFNDNATQKTTNFDNNASSKTTTFNENATSKTNDFNDNATAKTTAFNDNAQAKTEAFDEHTEEMQQEIDELSANMPWNTTEQATEISVDDAAKYSKNKLELFGNTEQDNTKITYKCDGSETGDYYLTYNSTDYYFTMPTIAEGDILVFNTTDLKLYLGDTEITTESTGTGTNLTFIPSPNPDFPQPIHVVTGNNSVGVQGKNLFDKNVERKNAYPGGEIGKKIAYVNSNATYSYVKCAYLEAGKTYTISWHQDIAPASKNDRVSRIIDENNINLVSFTSWHSNSNSISYTPSVSGYLVLSTDINSTNIMIEESSTATDYVPYYHADYPINLGSLELCKIGNYQDYFYKENGNWYKYEAIKKYIINENTKLYVVKKEKESTFCFQIGNQTSLISNNNFLRSNFYPNKVAFSTYACTNIYNKDVWFSNPYDSNFTPEMTQTEAKAKFHELYDNKLYYYTVKLSNPTQITDTTLISQLDEIYEHLKLVKGTNNITVTASDLKPYMELSYMQDLKSKLNNLDSRLALLE